MLRSVHRFVNQVIANFSFDSLRSIFYSKKTNNFFGILECISEDLHFALFLAFSRFEKNVENKGNAFEHISSHSGLRTQHSKARSI